MRFQHLDNCGTGVLNLTEWKDEPFQNAEFNFLFSNFRSDIVGLHTWDVSNVVTMISMFKNTVFNQSINNWNVGNVENMFGMFEGSLYNQPLNDWNTQNVEFMESMFQNAVFNQPINDWDVSNVETFGAMFDNNVHFNQPLDKWNLARAFSFNSMFRNAASFNQSLACWDIEGYVKMNFMFYNATSFASDLSGWQPSQDSGLFEWLLNTPIANETGCHPGGEGSCPFPSCPTASPTQLPSKTPTASPTQIPTVVPTPSPTQLPSEALTATASDSEFSTALILAIVGPIAVIVIAAAVVRYRFPDYWPISLRANFIEI